MSKLSNCLDMIQIVMTKPKMKIDDLAAELEVKPRMYFYHITFVPASLDRKYTRPSDDWELVLKPVMIK
ncbi:hypothetical protein ACTWP4_18105 [Gracilibacillus sp. D59]|uniref:hypothetical protein n=1 Tax=Gracilibacillus sp. D59 TaxID=3457434 RepID=UPI003FCCDE77